ncbi:MAG: hypothetical protein JSS02_21205 [Planctomycetes bacterium]|nr:hypothetical protein [Planctomycetota bacterium]
MNRQFHRTRDRLGFLGLVCSALTLVCAGSAPAARAGQILVNSDAHGYFDGPPREVGYDSDNFSDDLAGTASVLTADSTMSFTNGAKATASSKAAIGTLRAMGTASFPSAYGQGYITGSSSASFTEFVPLSGGVGTKFTYKLTMNVDGLHTVPGFEVGGTFSADVVASVRLSDNFGNYDSYTTWTATDTQQGTILTAFLSGQISSVSQHLIYTGTLSVGAYVSGSSAYRSAVSNYQNTAHFYLDAVTPGANTVGESGYNFASPSAVVPEPRSWLLLAVGVALLLARRIHSSRCCGASPG